METCVCEHVATQYLDLAESQGLFVASSSTSYHYCVAGRFYTVELGVFGGFSGVGLSFDSLENMASVTVICFLGLYMCPAHAETVTMQY